MIDDLEPTQAQIDAFEPTQAQIDALASFQEQCRSAGVSWHREIIRAFQRSGSRYAPGDAWCELQRLRNTRGGIAWAVSHEAAT